eukprot:TRINITY_DN26931_c0_g2_i2.p1 TRINITY_DN26931_c0_g2~~TRINITY_DN26931_c0_g2_i2.p1  ORF type:complete len:1346 (+),score=218.60 TRINITY_DN26931_c0_g2_i2:186-4223(+)
MARPSLAAQEAAEAALPKLQARIRRRLQISDRLADELRKRSSAATTLQAHMRGMKTRTAFEQEIKSRRELLAVLRTCMLRNKLALFLTNNKAMALQNQWRGAQARKKTRATFHQTKCKKQVKAVLGSVLIRLRFAAELSDKATAQLQKHSRSLQARKQLEMRKAERRDRMLVLAVLKTCRLRHRLEDSQTEGCALKLQALVRSSKAQKLRQAIKSAAIMLPVLKAIKLRMSMASLGETQVTRQLQAVRRSSGAKRKNRALCMQRLQRLLLGLMRRREAQKFVSKLYEEHDSHIRPMVYLGSVFKTVNFRTMIAERQEKMAATRIQARQRGIFGRVQAQEARKAWACSKIRLVLSRYKAQGQLVSLQKERDHTRAIQCYFSALKSVMLRSRFAQHVYYVSACERIARALRAYRARKYVTRVRWEYRAALACDRIKWVLKRNQMKELVLMLRQQNDIRTATSMILSVVRTLQWRALMDWEVQEARRKEATAIISCYVQGIKVRRGFHSDMINESGSVSIQESRRILALKGDLHVVDTVRTHVRRLRLEMEDERRQDLHLAAVRTQRSWRGRQTRLHKLLPRAAERLAAERRDLCELKNAESLSLASIDASPVGHGFKPIYVEVLKARPKPAQGWMAALAHMHEPAADLDLADSFAMVAGTSGDVYCLPSQAGTKLVGEPDILNFVGPMILGHRRLLVKRPIVVNISCGEHHAIMLSADGLAFAWGLNDSGQCGIGWPHSEAGEPPEKVVAQATCIQPWAAADTHLSTAAHGFWPGPAISEPKKGLILACGAVPPRLQRISCGPRHSAAVDIEGSLWLWGCKEAFGLTCLAPLKPPRSPPSRGVSFTGQKGAVKMPIHPFLLFQVMEGVQRKEGGVQWCRPNRQDVAGPGRASLLQPPDTGERYVSTSEKLSQESANRSRGKRATIHVHRGQEKSVEALALRQIEGNVLCPMLCCDITFLDAGGTALSSAMPDSAVLYSEANQPEALLSPGRGTAGGGYTRSEMTFVGVAAGKRANFATSNRHMVYSWGAQEDADDASILGRQLDDHDCAPAPIPAFLRLAINVTTLSLGLEHALALSSHGRVFTWGEMEACTIDQGFKRRLISQPHSVDGALRNVRVTQVSAGCTTNTVTLQDENVLGWEMVEISSMPQPKVLPAVFEYVALAIVADASSSVYWISSPKSASSSLASSPKKAELQAGRATPSARPSTPTGARSRLQPPLEPSSAAPRVVHKHSTTLQLLLVDPRPAPTRSQDLFVWAQRHSQTAQHMPPGEAKARDHQRKALAAVQEREHMRRLTPSQIVKDAVKPRTRFEMDREIARYSRLARPPAAGVPLHPPVAEVYRAERLRQ